jgi:asparagine synthase (glutamine-hydrolysing)
MSGIAGLWNFDGREIDRGVFGRIMLLMRPWGPDGTATWLGGNVALGYGAFHTTPEAAAENQPLSDSTGRFRLVFDGRIDNREELRRDLGAKGVEPRDDTDAELVLCAYALWKNDCAARLLGDFAFAILDAKDRQIYCARDILGCRPFYYHHDDKQFVFGSEVAEILEAPSVDTTPNEGVAAEFLADAVTSRDETLYQGVRRLPPAHFLLVTPRGLRCQRYWDIDLDRQIRFGNPEEYAEHFFELFREAAGCRMRSNGPVGAELSGGVDSTSVVGMAQHLFREGHAAAQGFETFSWVFPGMKCDESAYIDDVVRMWKLRSNTVRPQVEPRSFADQVRRSRYLTTDGVGVYADERKRLQHERGFRVILTGMGGDDWLSGADNPYPDLLKKLRFPAALSEFRNDAGELGRTAAARLLLRGAAHTVWPFSRALAARDRRLDRWPWLTKEFRTRTGLADRVASIYQGRTFPSNAQRERYWFLGNGWLPLGCEMSSWSCARIQVEHRHPLFDRRLIEFGFALPEDYRRRNGERKFLLRRAMKGLIPESVLTRCTKADFSHTMWESLDALGGPKLFERMSIADRGWVDRGRLAEMCRDGLSAYRSGGNPPGAWVVWSAYAIETWLRLDEAA